MAFDFFQEQDDEEKNQQGQPGQPAQPEGMVSLGPESATQEGQSRNQNAGQGGGTSSGAYTNLQSYLDANKSLNFGQEVAGKVQGQVDQANQAQDEAAAGFKEDVDKATVNQDDALLDQVGTDATKVTSNPNDFSSFLKMRNAQYGGPNNFIDEPERYGSASGATGAAREQVEATKSEGGRKALLDKTYGAGAGRYDYTAGQKNLDNLLIQNDPGSREAFQRAQEGAEASGKRLDDLSTSLRDYAGQGKAKTQATRAAARGRLGIDDAGNVLEGGPGEIQRELGSVDERVAARKAQLAADQTLLQPVAGKGWLRDLSPEQKAKLGLADSDFGAIDLYPNDTGYNRGSYSKYYQGFKVDPGYLFQQDPGSGSYLKFTSDPSLNRSSVATPEELAQLQALSELAGVDQSWISDPGQVGSQVDAPVYSFDKGKYVGDANARRNAFIAELQAARDKFEGSMSGSGLPGETTGGGLMDPSRLQATVNAIRAKYGLPPA